MALSSDLISQFVKLTNDSKTDKKETTVYGTIRIVNGSTYVRLDGAEDSQNNNTLIPVASQKNTTTIVNHGDRVTVLIKNHSAVVTGNITNNALGDKIKDADGNEIYISQVSGTVLANQGRITNLESQNVDITGRLTAAEADIGDLTANHAEFAETITGRLSAAEADIGDLTADHANFVETTTERLDAIDAEIGNLSVDNLDATYANIDFSNIDKAAIQNFYSKSGIIEDLVIGDETVTGKLVGVTISGDLIEGNTIKAEKLVVKGSDGLYYKLNTDGMTVEAEQTDENSLNGSIIKAKSITATKINVSDLVAFDATIGGFHITEDSLYSGVKETVNNTTKGIYLDSDGQMALGDANNFLRYYKDSDGNYKLEISASSFFMGGSSTTVEEEIETLKDEITTNLRIESSRGTVFKNDSMSTVLSAVIYRGSQRITDISTLRTAMGSGAYLQWKWQRLDDDSFGVISTSDSRIGNNGFTFTVSPEDVNTKVTFMCELIV